MEENLQTETNTQNQTNGKQPSLVRITNKGRQISKITPLIIVLIVIVAGAFSGLVLASRDKSNGQISAISQKEEISPEVQESLNQTFRDEAEGVIQKNDTLDKYAQGTHKLLRPGGESQTAYLTSSVLDLDEYLGKNVKVYGETFGSSQVGWLMDVGKVEEN